ncbi:MAG: hypothetical protein BM556_16130 [Bacteriovorax sp. MedPE-SWde]|nr:MAG: hypothetical protein BM556_16130 [Bacteriovorax sp. MedPE-SWde]
MKIISSLLILLLTLVSCGNGVNEVAHTGVCDGYLQWDNSDYVLPFPAGKSYKVTQSNCAPVSHFGSQQYAYDFEMKTSDSIVASRAGNVIEVVEGNEDGNGCPDDNHVYIQHTDGSVAHYLHLTKNGAVVNVGDSVSQGDPIGLAGNTGCSTDTHLHFVVFKSKSYEESLPITFSNTDSNARGLKTDSTYTAK